MLARRTCWTITILVSLLFLSGYGYGKEISSPNRALKKACIRATIKGLELEMGRNRTWLEHAKDDQRRAQLRKRMDQLAAEITKYQNLDLDDYKLPPKKEMEAWFAGPCRENAVLNFEGLSRSGPWYHVTGIHGNIFSAIKPQTKYQMTFYLVYPRQYAWMESYYIYIDKFTKE